MQHSPGFLKLVTEAKAHVREISLDQARQRLKENPQAVLLDVREDHEWQKEHAAEAVHLGKGIFERDLEARFPDAQTELIMYCGGGYRSALTAHAAQKMGYGNVFSLAGGYKAMVQAQWPMSSLTTMNAEAKLTELKLQLPPAPKPAGVYKPVVVTGNLAYVSGHGPLLSDGKMITGRVGADMTLEQGQEAARQVGLALLASFKAELGSLDKIKRVIKLLGMVNCTDDFQKHPAVINGCSQLFAELFGPDHGVGARSAVGMNSLPGNIAVEIEAIFEITP